MEHFVEPGIGSAKLNQSDLISSSVDIFSYPKILNNYESQQDVIFSADNIADESGPYKFHITGNPHQYIKPSSIYVELKLQLLKKDGTKVTAADQVYPVVNLGASLFDSISFEINNQTISELTQNHFAYKNYIQNLISYSTNAGATYLVPRLFMPDKAGFFDNNTQWKLFPPNHNKTTVEASHTTVVRRETLCSKDYYRMFLPIGADWLQAKQLIKPQTDIKITFKRTPPEFYLLTLEENKDYKIHIADMKLHVTYVTINPHIKERHDASFKKGEESIMDFQRVELTTRQFPAGLTELSFNNFINGGIEPKQIVVGLVKTKAFDGDKKESPFTFRNANVSKVYLRRNNAIFPNEPAKYDFPNNDYVIPYSKGFLKSIGYAEKDQPSLVSFQNYKHDYTLHAFDLTPDGCVSYHHHPARYGNMDIKMELSEPTTEALTMIVLHSYDKLLSFKPNGEVYTRNIG